MTTPYHPPPAAPAPARDGERLASSEPPPDDVSVISAVNVLLRHRAWIIGIALLAFVPTVARSLLSPRGYEAVARFMPQAKSQGSSSAVAGLAAQFGINVAGGQPGETPDFYLDLVTSRPVLRDVAAARYSFPTDSGPQTTTLLDLYGGRPEAHAAVRRDNAIEQLERQVKATAAGTSVVTLRVRAHNPVLAQQIAAGILERVNRFNLEQRQSQAAAERRFAERRLAEARETLRAAETRLQIFLQQNRNADAPALRFEEDRLQREVGLQQGLATTLAQAQEQARLQEVRDIPVITVLERPEVPARPKGRGTIKKGLIALVAGLAFGVLIAFLRELFSHTANDSHELAEFAALKRATVADITHPWRPVARAFDRRAPPDQHRLGGG